MSTERQNRPFSIIDATFNELQQAMETGMVTSRDLVETYLNRIEANDRKGPKLQAMLSINPYALEQADELDKERQQQGSRGPLHGIPIVVKDNYNTADMPTTGGTKALAGFVASTDCHIVQNLRNAGAIILGKTNLHELALFGLSWSTLGGQTKNPYDLTKTPGGSSGGTGVAVSANFAAAGTGTDAVNSIRSPASANNLVGIRPTKGLMNLEGILPVSCTQDNAGPIARTVEDAAILFEAMEGYSHTYSSDLNNHGLNGKRIGVLRSFFGKSEVHEEVNLIAEHTLRQMQELGAQMIDLAAIDLEAERLLLELDVQRFEIRNELERYFTIHQAPVQTMEELLIKGNYEPSIEKFLKTAIAIEEPLNHPEYHKRLKKINELKEELLSIFSEHLLDALVYPHQKRLVVDIGEASQYDRNGILAALTGFPAITFQGGFSSPSKTAPIGIPIGIELLGKPYDDAKIIQMAYACEAAVKERRIPPFTINDI
ncbi:amidase family protein [Paenibacillus solisilvae]|uniref:Amidase family protein n=1 Tax=Paenibacillus solisilvae TaxID=2486751 RepID=A0ABW0W8K2_9BACL